MGIDQDCHVGAVEAGLREHQALQEIWKLFPIMDDKTLAGRNLVDLVKEGIDAKAELEELRGESALHHHIALTLQDRVAKLEEVLMPFAKLATEIEGRVQSTGIDLEGFAKSCDWVDLLRARNALEQKS